MHVISPSPQLETLDPDVSGLFKFSRMLWIRCFSKLLEMSSLPQERKSNFLHLVARRIAEAPNQPRNHQHIFRTTNRHANRAHISSHCWNLIMRVTSQISQHQTKSDRYYWIEARFEPGSEVRLKFQDDQHAVRPSDSEHIARGSKTIYEIDHNSRHILEGHDWMSGQHVASSKHNN